MLKSEIASLSPRYRTNLINSLSGFKSGNLIGTIGPDGQENLAIFTSVVHLGANPALMGFIMRPVSVPRHTYENIIATKSFTINQVATSFYKKAHQTAARYDREMSEFAAAGLTPFYSENIKAPYVKESQVKIGLSFVEALEIKANGTQMIIGAIEEIVVAPELILPDGYLDLEKAGTVAVSCLDGYHQTQQLARLTYAKPDRLPEEISRRDNSRKDNS